MTRDEIADPYASSSFEEFWPHYVRLHRRPETHWAHAVGTSASIALFMIGLRRRNLLVAALGPLADYAISQASHRFFEKNATTPYAHFAWHTRAEMRMFRLVLTGKMKAEVDRHAA